MSGRAERVATVLEGVFAPKHIRATLGHFEAATDAFRSGDWEEAIAKCGKFIEAVLKTLCAHVGQPAVPGRGFKADSCIKTLENTRAGAFDDAVRLTIPRACRFGYDIASNRGGRHDPDDIDPNEMDATVLVGVCAWMLAELLRHSGTTASGPADRAELIRSLMARRYPVFEDVEGRVYSHAKGASARDVALALLWNRHPSRISSQELVNALRRHRFTEANARKAVGRLAPFVDQSDEGFRLLAPGLREAEELAHSSTTGH